MTTRRDPHLVPRTAPRTAPHTAPNVAGWPLAGRGAAQASSRLVSSPSTATPSNATSGW